MMQNNRGFTLVETAVVLVIIGLILGGILGSRSMIRSMQAKDVVAIIEDLRAATTYFKQRRGYLPGDFPVSTAGEIPNINPPGGNGNGTINGTINALGMASIGSETEAAPLHLYNDGLLGKINTGDSRRRITTIFGAVHLIAPASCGVAGFPASVRNVIVFTNLPRDIVAEVDSKIDDGDPLATTGRAFGNAPNASDVVVRYAIALD